MEQKAIFGKLRLLGIGMTLGVLTACASTGDMNSTRAAANNAAHKADEAQSTASTASQKADASASRANQATQLAQNASVEANKTSQEVKELNQKMDRMFQKSMNK